MQVTSAPDEPVEQGEYHGAPIPTVTVDELMVPVADPSVPDVRLRLHRPPDAPPRTRLPVLLTFFGGGFVTGSIDDAQNRWLAAQRCRSVHIIVAAVEYALAPEHRCPTPVRQGLAALAHLRKHADELAIDPARIVLGGQSAGGNIAAVVALEDAARRGPSGAGGLSSLGAGELPSSEAAEQPPSGVDQRATPDVKQQAASTAARPLSGLVLEVPVLDLSAETVDPSLPNDMGLTPSAYMRYRAMVRERYQGPGADRLDPLACPLRHPALADLPPTVLLAAEKDPLRADAEAFHDRLRERGVPVSMAVVRGLTHDGFRAVGADPSARLWHRLVEAELRSLVHRSACA